MNSAGKNNLPAMRPSKTTIPTIDQCYALMEQHHMLPHIKEHSIMVARVAQTLTTGLLEAGHGLSLDMVVGGALLHDIGKTACLDNDDDHAAIGYEICIAHNLDPIADIVAEHVILQNYSKENSITEKQIVYYADKRVNHDQVVSLEKRLAYILERYGMNNVKRGSAIKKNYALCQDLERRMFSFLPFKPEEIGNLLAELR
jgi:putative nucleotidyltransferase with HDIG domain